MHRGNVLCDARTKKHPVWFLWDGIRWTETCEESVRELAHQVGVEYVHQAADYRSGDSERERAVRKLAERYLATGSLNNTLVEARPYMQVKIEDFDQNDYLLTYRNGTLDLSADPPVLREHHREDRITRLIDFDYDPDAACPEFERWLLETMGGNPDSDDDTAEQRNAKEMVECLQRVLGCSLCGDVGDKVIDIFNGPTDTGKTTLLFVIRYVMPDYSVEIPLETLLAKDRDSSIEEPLFSLRGKRFAMTSETERGHTLSSARIKQITQGAGGTITVTPKFKPSITFKATHHLFVDCNFRPRVWGGDDAMWNRLRLSNFPHRIPREKQVKGYYRELLKERQGIMAWLVRGFQKYKKSGVPTVADMQKYLKGWREENQRLHDFVETYCSLEQEWTGKDANGNPIELPKDWVWAVAQNELWKCYSNWVATQEREKRLKKTAFYEEIACLPGVQQGRPTIGKTQTDGFFGIVLKK